MYYLDYHICAEKYRCALALYNELIEKKEIMFERTQPGAVRYDKDHVSGGGGNNSFEDYLIAKERSRIDERINEQKTILDERKRLKELKEIELKQSKSLYDRLYIYRYLDNLSLTQIEMRIPYSRVQIWRILKKIQIDCELL